MRPTEARTKGYEFACQCVDRMRAWAPDLTENNMRANPPSMGGEDIYLDNVAEQFYPFAVECKNQKTVSIKAWMKQAEGYRTSTKIPLVMFKHSQPGVKKTNQKILVCLELDDLLMLIR